MFLCINIFRRQAGGMNSPDNAGNKWFILFLIPRPVRRWTPLVWSWGCGKTCFLFMWLLKPLPIRLPFVGSRSAGFFPSPAVRLDFRFQLASRGGESTLHLFKERTVDCFFPSQLSPVVSNISTTCSLDFGNSCALRPLYFARSVCVNWF